MRNTSLGKIVLLSFSIVLFHYSLSLSERDPQLNLRLPKVLAMKVGMSSSSKDLLTGMGSISCPKTVELGFDDNGVISEIMVEEGDPVREGQVLARLDSSVLEAEKRANEAKLAHAEAELNYNRNELEKKESLFSKNAVSDTDLRKAVLELDKSKASIEYHRAEIRMADAKLRKRTLLAPSSGMIAEKHAEVGSVVTYNSNKIVTLIQCKKAFADIELAENLFSVIRKDMPVTIKIDALAGQSFEGKIVRVSPQIDKKNRTFLAKAEIDNSKWLVRPGMFVRAEIDVSKNQNPVSVPLKALVNVDPLGSGTVFVIKDGLAMKRSVIVAKTMGDRVLISQGLKKGELVIIHGHEKIQDLTEVQFEISDVIPEQ